MKHSWVALLLGLLAAAVLSPVSRGLPPASSRRDRMTHAVGNGLQPEEASDALIEGRARRSSVRDERREGSLPPHAELAYGPHVSNVLDLWLAPSKTPTPLLLCIHGGGFRGGDKADYARPGLIRRMHRAGVSVALINYRLSDGGEHPYPAAMLDGARAIQFLRYQAVAHNLDKSRFAATGTSAGGCMLMWLGFHDDLADPQSADPVLRESSRLQLLMPVAGPSSLHVPTLQRWFGVTSLVELPALRPFFGLPLKGDIRPTPELDAMMLDASPITHLSADDPPIYLSFGTNRPVDEATNPRTWAHHPVTGIKLKEAMDALGMECHLQYDGGPPVEKYDGWQDFLIRRFGRPPETP